MKELSWNCVNLWYKRTHKIVSSGRSKESKDIERWGVEEAIPTRQLSIRNSWHNIKAALGLGSGKERGKRKRESTRIRSASIEVFEGLFDNPINSSWSRFVTKKEQCQW